MNRHWRYLKNKVHKTNPHNGGGKKTPEVTNYPEMSNISRDQLQHMNQTILKVWRTHPIQWGNVTV